MAVLSHGEQVNRNGIIVKLSLGFKQELRWRIVVRISKVCFIKEWRKVSESYQNYLKAELSLNINSKIWNGILKWIVFKEIKKFEIHKLFKYFTNFLGQWYKFMLPMFHFQHQIESSLFHKLTFLDTSSLIIDLTVPKNWYIYIFCVEVNIYLVPKTKSVHSKNVFGICDRAKHCIHFTDAWYLCQWRKNFSFHQHILSSDSLRK